MWRRYVPWSEGGPAAPSAVVSQRQRRLIAAAASLADYARVGAAVSPLRWHTAANIGAALNYQPPGNSAPALTSPPKMSNIAGWFVGHISEELVIAADVLHNPAALRDYRCLSSAMFCCKKSSAVSSRNEKSPHGQHH